MKNKRCILFVVLIISGFIVTSCKNFFDGTEFLRDLTDVIDYVNTAYSDITLTAFNSYTESITPPATNYNDKYKKGDEININLSIKPSYQFVEWSATPSDAIEFSSKSSLLTTAKVLKDDIPITIEPIVCERPTVNFLPANVVAVEKNSAVVITFSHELNLTDDITLDLIKIVNEYGTEIQSQNFLPPVLDETKKVVTFDPNPENLISFEGNTLGITVKIPATFHYLYGNEKICLEKDVEYSYKVNQETLEKLELTFVNPDANAGTANLDGEVKLNLGQTQTLKFNILQDYYFEKWQILDSEGKFLNRETYNQFLDIGDENQVETSITAKKVGSGYTIKPKISIRPKIVAFAPGYSTIGVDRGSEIRVIFDQSMSIHSIYYTKSELEKEKKKYSNATFNYESYRIDEKDENGNDLYYCFSVNDGKEEHKYYKNIKIKLRNSEKSFIDGNYYGVPYFETDSILVIPVFGEVTYVGIEKQFADILPAYSDIEVTIEGDFVSNGGVKISGDYVVSYHTNGNFDNVAPRINNGGTVYSILGCTGKNKEEWNLIWQDNNEDTKEGQNYYYYLEDVKNAESISALQTLGVKDTKSITINQLDVEDDSGISDVVFTLYPVENKIYKDQSKEIMKFGVKLNEEKRIEIDGTDQSKFITVDFSPYKIEGVYKIVVSVVDIIGNISDVKFQIRDKYKDSSGSHTVYHNKDLFCIIDNVYNGDFDFAPTSANASTGTITGSVADYFWLAINKNINKQLALFEGVVSNIFVAPELAEYIVPITQDGEEKQINRYIETMLDDPYGYFIISQDAFGNIKLREYDSPWN